MCVVYSYYTVVITAQLLLLISNNLTAVFQKKKILLYYHHIRMYWPVDEFAADAPLEEPAATVARQYAVVLSAWRVAAHDASQSQCLGLGYRLATRRRVMSRSRGARSRRRSGRGHRYLLGCTSGWHAERQRPVPHGITWVRICSKRNPWPSISVEFITRIRYGWGWDLRANKQGCHFLGFFLGICAPNTILLGTGLHVQCFLVPIVKYYENLV